MKRPTGLERLLHLPDGRLLYPKDVQASAGKMLAVTRGLPNKEFSRCRLALAPARAAPIAVARAATVAVAFDAAVTPRRRRHVAGAEIG